MGTGLRALSQPLVLLPGLTGPVVSPSAPQTQTAPPRRPVVLLAEDVREILDIYAYILMRRGFEVHGAEDGVQAVEIAPTVRPDIALLNNLMPRMSGIAACRLISEMPCLDGLPIVVYSAIPLEEFRIPAFEAGAWTCWHTPLGAEELVQRTTRVLARGDRDPIWTRRRR